MSVLQDIEGLIAPVLAGHHIELIDAQYRRESGGWVLRLYVDHTHQSGEGQNIRRITLDDCQNVSRWVEEVLYQSDSVSGNYSLEVSSPGINRPLKTLEHFKRHVGQKAKISLFAPLSSESPQKNFTGIIANAADGTVELNDVVSGNVEIPISAISKAHLDLI